MLVDVVAQGVEHISPFFVPLSRWFLCEVASYDTRAAVLILLT